MGPRERRRWGSAGRSPRLRRWRGTPVDSQRRQHVPAGDHFRHRHVLLGAVKAGASRSEQHRRCAGRSQHGGVGPEAHSYSSGVDSGGSRGPGECLGHRMVLAQSRTVASRSRLAQSSRTSRLRLEGARDSSALPLRVPKPILPGSCDVPSGAGRRPDSCSAPARRR